MRWTRFDKASIAGWLSKRPPRFNLPTLSRPATPKNGCRSSGGRTIATRRAQRIEAQIAREVSDLIERELEDPAIGFVTVQRVSISPDLGQAVVFVTPLGDAHNIGASVAALQRASTFVRRALAARIRVYRIPRIQFQLDPEMLTAEAIAQRRTEGEATDQGTDVLTVQPCDGR
ncbi:MAG: 30S ribosome-binding factor RbfA [Chloroflexi bacterium]|nr:30S ribosome-binding factor RbfA [Chloroflexota bacterium]